MKRKKNTIIGLIENSIEKKRKEKQKALEKEKEYERKAALEYEEKRRKELVLDKVETLLRILGDPIEEYDSDYNARTVGYEYIIDSIRIKKSHTTSIEVYLDNIKVMDYNYYAKKFHVFANGNWPEIITKLYNNSSLLKKEKINKDTNKQIKKFYSLLQPSFDDYLAIESNSPECFKILTDLLMENHIVIKKVNYRNTTTNAIRTEYQIYHYNEKVGAFSKVDGKYLDNDTIINSFNSDYQLNFNCSPKWKKQFVDSINKVIYEYSAQNEKQINVTVNKTLELINKKFK